MTSERPRTLGVHHVGLAVPDLAAAKDFFVAALGFKLLREDAEYPSAFVSDGTSTVTLWQVRDPASAMPFDRRRNVGLHHLAFRVDRDDLLALFERVKQWRGVVVDVAPGRIRPGADSTHFLVFMPGGIRLEFVCSPALPD